MTFLTLRDGHLRIYPSHIASIEGPIVTLTSGDRFTLAENDMQTVLKAIEGNRSTVPAGITLEDGLPVPEYLTEPRKPRTKAGK